MYLFDIHIYNNVFTPLKIYNGTHEGVLKGQQLPINELNGTPLLGAYPISNLHRFILDRRLLKNRRKEKGRRFLCVRFLRGLS